MIKKSSDPLALPRGIDWAVVHVGWPTAHFFVGTEEYEMRQFGAISLPSSFEVDIAFVDDRDSVGGQLGFILFEGSIELVRVESLIIEADEFLRRALSEWSLASWKDYSVRYLAHQALMGPKGDSDEAGATTQAMALLKVYRMGAGKPLTRRRDRVTDEKLLEVTTIYRKALSSGLPPTRAVQDHFSAKDNKKVAYSTAARWVGLARKVPGGLGPAVGKLKAGERTNDEA